MNLKCGQPQRSSRAEDVPSFRLNRPSGPLDDPHGVAAGLLVRAQAQQSTLLCIGEHVIERSKAVETFVEARLAPFDSTTAALLGECFQRLDNLLQGRTQIGALLLG